MELSLSIPWRLMSLLAAVLLLSVLLLRLHARTQASIARWLRRRSAGAVLYCALAVLILSSVMASRTAPLPPFGREHDLQQALQTARSAVADLENQKVQLSEEREQLNHTIEQGNQSLRELERQLADLQQQNEQLASQAIPPTDRELGLPQALQTARSAVADLEIQRAQLLEEGQQLNDTIEQGNESLRALERQLADLQQQNEQLANQASDRQLSLENQIAELRAELERDQLNLEKVPPSYAIARLVDIPQLSVEVGYGGLEAAAFERGDLDKALRYYEKLANAAIEEDYLSAAALAHENLSIVSLLDGDEDRARAEHQEALRLLGKIGRVAIDMVSVYDLLGISDLIMQDVRKAKEFYADTARSLAQNEGYMWGVGSENVNAGVASYVMSEFAESAQLLKEAVGIFEELNAKPSEAMARSNLAIAYDALGKNDMAASEREEARDIVRRLGQ